METHLLLLLAGGVLAAHAENTVNPSSYNMDNGELGPGGLLYRDDLYKGSGDRQQDTPTGRPGAVDRFDYILLRRSHERLCSGGAARRVGPVQRVGADQQSEIRGPHLARSRTKLK